MGLFGESKKDIIDKYEKWFEQLKNELNDKTSEIERLKEKINSNVNTKETEKFSSNTQNSQDKNGFILHAGRYMGGKTIPIGVYDLFVISGTGTIGAEIPNHIYIRLEKSRGENFPENYSGLVVTDETILEITESAKIRFQLTKEISYDDEYSKYVQKRDELKKEIEYLQKIRDNEKVQVGDVFILGQGTYYGGKTIPTGIYNLKAIAESSMIETSKPKNWFNIGTGKSYCDNEYIGLEIGEDTVLKINNKCKIEFWLTIKLESEDEIERKKRELDRLRQEIKHAQNLLNIEKQRVQQKEFRDGIITLEAGKYKGGRDIPPGKYDLVLLSGEGNFEADKPDDIYFRMTQNPLHQEQFGWICQYKNLEISEKSKIKISESAKIKFIKKFDYSFKGEKEESCKEYVDKDRELDTEYVEKYFEYREKYNKIQSEIESIKSEMKILNNTAIEKYYALSDYDGISSLDCKNKLLLLKTQEKALRESELDVVILNNSEKKKLIDRSVRQILRNFNADCDNQIMNIGIKNIDMVRNRIQKSYDTLNKLYSVDGVALSEAILSLKLEQATLLYGSFHYWLNLTRESYII